MTTGGGTTTAVAVKAAVSALSVELTAVNDVTTASASAAVTDPSGVLLVSLVITAAISFAAAVTFAATAAFKSSVAVATLSPLKLRAN